MSERMLHVVAECSLEDPQVEIHSGQQAFCPFSPSGDAIPLKRLDDNPMPNFACANKGCNYHTAERTIIWKSAPMKKAPEVSSQSQ